jgi:starch-binding outer membrane protein SusE/F
MDTKHTKTIAMKHTLISRIALLSFILVFFTKCEKDERDLNMDLTEVKNLFTPVDGESITLKPASGATVSFEWEQAKAADGSLVLYEVAFDQQTGDFTTPFYTVVSDNRGVNNKLTLTHGDLNKIAELGGAKFFEKKKFKWTVLASKGTNVKKSTMTRTLELERPGGFDVLPGTLYLTGSATENGDALANAMKMKQTSPGVFEIYSKLKAGTYKFVEGTTGTPKSYYIFDDNGIKAIGMNGETTFSGSDKIMRIRLDFNNINASYAEVKEVKLWYSAGNTFWTTLSYTSNGIWRKDNQTVTYTQMPWGFDERYKYLMVIDEGAGNKDQWLNSNFGDPAGQDGQYPSSETYRTINFTANNSSQWDWGWKFDRNYLPQGTVASFWVSLRGSDNAYTQNYQK